MSHIHARARTHARIHILDRTCLLYLISYSLFILELIKQYWKWCKSYFQTNKFRIKVLCECILIAILFINSKFMERRNVLPRKIWRAYQGAFFVSNALCFCENHKEYLTRCICGTVKFMVSFMQRMWVFILGLIDRTACRTLLGKADFTTFT